MNLLNCYNAQGNFSPKLYYSEKYGIIPNQYEISLSEDKAINVVKLLDLIPEIFGKDVIIINICASNNRVLKTREAKIELKET